MSNNQFPAPDNIKMTCQIKSTKVSSKITIRKSMFTLTLFDLEFETSVSNWEFEIINVLNDSFAFISACYTFKFIKHK